MRPASPPVPRQPIGALLIALLIAAIFLFGLFSSTQFLSTVALRNVDSPTDLSFPAVAGQVAAMVTLVYGVVALMIGPLLTRLGYNRSFLLGAALSAVGMGALLLPVALPSLMVAQGLLSAGTAIIGLSASLYLLIHGRRRLMVWLPIAGLLGQLAGNALVGVADVTGQPQVMYLLLTLSAVAAFTAFALTRLRWRTAMLTGEAIWYYNPLQTLRDPRTGAFLGLMACAGVLKNLVTNATQSMVFLANGTPLEVANWLAFGWVGGIIGIALWGWLSGRMTAARLVLIGLGGTLAGLALLWLLPAPIVYAGIQFFLTALGSLALLHALDRAAVNYLPGLLGWSVVVATILTPVIQALMNMIVSSLGILPALLLTALAVAAISLAAWWWSQREIEAVKETKKRLDPDETVNSKDHITQEIPTALRGGKGGTYNR